MMLHFRPEYVPLILSGKKRVSIRLGTRKVRPGMSIVLAVSGKPFARARIVRVERKRLRDVSVEDVRKDGFKTKEEFLAAFRRIYPSATLDDEVTVIEWELLSD